MSETEALGRLLVGAMQTGQQDALTVLTEAIVLLDAYRERFGEFTLETIWEANPND